MYNYKYPHTHTHPEIERDQRQSIANQETHQEDSHWDKQDQAPRRPIQDFQPYLEKSKAESLAIAFQNK